jgi:mono/diheme cytochrome c family protein
MRARRALGLGVGALLAVSSAHAQADTAPRVPPAERAAARSLANPLAASRENVERGRVLYQGKGFCSACHGGDGRGLGADVEAARLRGALPRDLTDPAWQRARSDGELFWVLRNGSAGSAMGAFVPLVLSDAEAWQVILYVRSLAP